MTGTRVYRIWAGVVQRCTNPNADEWRLYGGKGVKLHPRWREFGAFYEDMGDPPAGHSIERKNSAGDYEPSNCVWATATQQARNTTRNRLVTYNNKTLCVAEWAQLRGIPRKTLTMRLNYGWSPAQALEYELRPHHNTKKHTT